MGPLLGAGEGIALEELVVIGDAIGDSTGVVIGPSAKTGGMLIGAKEGQSLIVLVLLLPTSTRPSISYPSSDTCKYTFANISQNNRTTLCWHEILG